MMRPIIFISTPALDFSVVCIDVFIPFEITLTLLTSPFSNNTFNKIILYKKSCKINTV